MNHASQLLFIRWSPPPHQSSIHFTVFRDNHTVFRYNHSVFRDSYKVFRIIIIQCSQCLRIILQCSKIISVHSVQGCRAGWKCKNLEKYFKTRWFGCNTQQIAWRCILLCIWLLWGVSISYFMFFLLFIVLLPESYCFWLYLINFWREK